MADNWRVIDLTYSHSSLRFDKKGRRLDILDLGTGEVASAALHDVNIIFIGIAVRLEPATLYHLAKNDVVVVFCDWKGLPVGSVYPWIDAHGRVAARQRAQASLSSPRRKNAWMRIVKAKVSGQANVLKCFHSNKYGYLSQLAGKVRSGDPSNVEGQAARAYWLALFGNDGFVRRPGEGAGGRNSLLDYGYTILRGHSMRAVISAGLTPALGLHHCDRSNAFALADDLIEPFRPAIDYVVVELGCDADLNDRDVRYGLMHASLSVFDSDGRTIPTVMTDFAQHFGRYVEGEVDYLDVPVWRPPGELRS